MKAKLITALRTAANALENGTFAYNWQKPESCNCGIIASTLLHKSVSELRSELPSFPRHKHGRNTDCSWKAMVQHHCPVTGLSQNVVLRELQSAGMTQRDIVELETLSNKEVCERAGITRGEHATRGIVAGKEIKQTKVNGWFDRTFHRLPEVETTTTFVLTYDDKNVTILYMRAWADILEEQGKMDQPEVESRKSSRITSTP